MPVQYQIVCDECNHQFKLDNETIYYAPSDCMERGPMYIGIILCKKCMDKIPQKISDRLLPVGDDENFIDMPLKEFLTGRLPFYDFIQPTFVYHPI